MSPVRLASLTAAVLLGVLVAAPAASARLYDVVDSLGSRLDRVAARTSVPVRVPRQLDLDFDGRVYAEGTGARRSYSLSLAGAPRCGNATACFLAELSGERGGTPAFRTRVALRGGRTGYYKPLSCGASCSDPMIQWKQGGVLYTIQASIGRSGARAQRAAMIQAANSAIAADPR